MKVYAFSKSPLTHIRLFSEPLNAPFSYAVVNIAETLRQEQRDQTDLGKAIYKSFLKNQYLNEELREQLWYQILSKQRNEEVLFVHWFKVEDIKLILKFCDGLKTEFKSALHFLIPYPELLKRANYMAHKADGPNSKPRNNIIDDIRLRNDTIQQSVDEARSFTKVIDINCLCSDEELFQEIIEIVQE